MIRTVADLKRALDAYPDTMPVQTWSHRLREYKPVMLHSYYEDDFCVIEPFVTRSDLMRMREIDGGYGHD